MPFHKYRDKIPVKGSQLWPMSHAGSSPLECTFDLHSSAASGGHMAFLSTVALRLCTLVHVRRG